MPSDKGSASDPTPIVVGVVSAVAGAAAIVALAVLLKRRRPSNTNITHLLSVSPVHDDDVPEQGRDQPHDDVRPTASAVLAVDAGGVKPPSHLQKASLHRQTPAEAVGNMYPKSMPVSLTGPLQSSTGHAKGTVEDESPPHQHNASLYRHTLEEAERVDGEDIRPKSAPPPLVGPMQSSAHHAANAVEDGGAEPTGEDSADCSAETLMITTGPAATATTANVYRCRRAGLAQIHPREGVAGKASLASGSLTKEPSGGRKEASCGSSKQTSGGSEDVVGGSGTSSPADRQKPAGDIGLGHAVLAAAQELAHRCQVPGVSEAASAVCIMATLVTDNRDNDRSSESRLRQCRSIVMALKRADKVVAKVS